MCTFSNLYIIQQLFAWIYFNRTNCVIYNIILLNQRPETILCKLTYFYNRLILVIAAILFQQYLMSPMVLYKRGLWILGQQWKSTYYVWSNWNVNFSFDYAFIQNLTTIQINTNLIFYLLNDWKKFYFIHSYTRKKKKSFF